MEKELGIAVIGIGENARPHLVDLLKLKDPSVNFESIAKEIKNDEGKIPELKICILQNLNILNPIK